MDNLIHSEHCKKNSKLVDESRAAYAEQWPNYCKTCGGWGGELYSFDPSPAGVSLSSGSMQDYDPCPDCIDKAICPRCGHVHNLDHDFYCGDAPCDVCGFVEGKTDGMLSPHECYCWEMEINQPDSWLDQAYEDRFYDGIE